MFELAVSKLDTPYVHQKSVAPVFGTPPGMMLSDVCHPSLPSDLGTVRVYGTLVVAEGERKGVNPSSLNTFRSNIKLSPMAHDPVVQELLGDDMHKFPPSPRSLEHYVRVVGRMDHAEVEMADDDPALVAAKLDLTALYRSIVAECGTLRPLTLFEAINGAPGIAAFPLDTSPGFGLPGKKRDYLAATCAVGGCGDSECALYHPTTSEHVVPGRVVNYYPTGRLLEQINEIEAQLAKKCTGLAVFRAALKDEPVPKEKEKIRVFFVGMCAWNIVVRRYFAPLIEALGRDRVRSECAVGMDVLSVDWEHLQTHLDEFSTERRLAGDYSNYDNSIPGTLIKHVYDVMIDVVEFAGYSGDAVESMQTIALNMKNPKYIVLGTVFDVDGTNPSGIPITTHVNSGVNCLVHRTAFYQKNKDLQPLASQVVARATNFSSHVRLATYGDDVEGAPRENAGDRLITNHDVKRAAKALGMVFGPTDKTTTVLPEYYTAEDVTFLKCSSVYVPELGRRMGKIALSSVRKCLTYQRNDAPEARRSTCESALRLYFATAATEEGGVANFSRLRDCLLHHLEPDALADSREAMLPTFGQVLEGLRASRNADDGPSLDLIWDEI
jgi:hypothetical protein